MKRLLIFLFSISLFTTTYAQTPSACFSTGNDISFEKPFSGTRNIAKGDFDNDGHMDVVVNNYVITTSNSYTFFKGLGNGKFDPTTISGNGSKQANDIAAHDFNADGNLDIVLAEFNGVTVYFGQGNGSFTLNATYVNGTYAKYMDISDVNNDGAMDIVFTVG
jgi:hypothetical protein